MKIPKILQRIIKKKQFYVKCLKCKKSMIGTSEGQVIYNYETHYNKCIKEDMKNDKKDIKG